MNKLVEHLVTQQSHQCSAHDTHDADEHRIPTVRLEQELAILNLTLSENEVQVLASVSRSHLTAIENIIRR